MKSILKKSVSLLLSVILCISAVVVASAEEAAPCDCGNTPSIIVPGLMQSETYLYNEDGSINTDYEAPFFLEDTDTIISTAMGKVLMPLLKVLLTQQDTNGEFAQAFADTLGSILGDKIRADENGNSIFNVDASHYAGSFAACTPEQQAHILNNVPIQGFLDAAGEDHLYYFSYHSFGNLDQITERLYNLIQQVKEETGHDKVNLVPISQGGVVTNNLLELYPDVVDSFDKMVYVIPCLDGTAIISDIYVNGLLDDPEAIYGYMIPMLLDDDMTSKLVKIALRLLPEDVLQNMLDKAADTLFGVTLKNNTTMWAFLKTKDYEIAADKYLSGEENAEIRRQTDSYQRARVNSDANILRAIEHGVQVFNIVDYNVALYPIVDSWNKINADGVIDLDSTSMGAYAAPVGETLPAGYTQQGNSFGTCTDPSHNHIDPYNIVDASTGLLPDHTFYFYNAPHEETGRNDVLIGLIIDILIDDNFTSVYSYPEKYPQFNEARRGRDLRNLSARAHDFLATAGEDEYPELRAALAKVDDLIDDTVVNYEETNAAKAELEREYKIANNESVTKETSFFDTVLEKVVDGIFAMVEKQFPNRSFSGK